MGTTEDKLSVGVHVRKTNSGWYQVSIAGDGHPRPLKGLHIGQVLYGAAEILGNWEEASRY